MGGWKSEWPTPYLGYSISALAHPPHPVLFDQSLKETDLGVAEFSFGP